MPGGIGIEDLWRYETQAIGDSAKHGLVQVAKFSHSKDKKNPARSRVTPPHCEVIKALRFGHNVYTPSLHFDVM